jgi:UDP-glucose 4-epimerase
VLTHNRSAAGKPSRVVILGAHGFVAPALAGQLRTEGVDTFTLGSAAIDLMDPHSVQGLAAALKDGDVVVMLSALTPDKGRDVATLAKNLRMAEHVAAGIAGRRLAQFLYVSSDAVYGGPAAPFTESTPAAPLDLYGLMHRGRELALGESTSKTGVPFCVLRPCAIYGQGDTHNSYGPNRFVRSAVTEKKIRLFGTGEEIRDHVYIRDVAVIATQAILRCSSGTVNVVSGRGISFGNLSRLVAQMTGGTTIESLPAAGTVTHREFDPQALRESFPEHVTTPLEVGLREMIDSFPRG